MTSSAGMFGLATIVDVPDIYIAPSVPGQSSEELDECSRPDIKLDNIVSAIYFTLIQSKSLYF